MAVIDALDRFLAACALCLRTTATAILVLMLLLNLVNMVLRLVHMREINQIVPWTEFLFVWTCFLGFFVMHYQRRDIVVDYVVRRFAVVGRTTARVVTNVLIAIMLAIALAQMPRIVRLQSGIINMVNVPRYMLSVPFFISAALILLDTIVDTARALAGVPLVIETPAEIEIDG